MGHATFAILDHVPSLKDTSGSMEAGPEITRVLIEAAVQYEQRKEVSSKTVDRIKRIFFILSEAYAAGLGLEFESSLDYPGYIRRRLGKFWLFIPFHLVHYFPDDATLEEVVSLAELVALKGTNAICISGSMTIYRAVTGVADVDFCEYYVAADHSDSAASTARLVSEPSERLYIAKLCYLVCEYDPPTSATAAALAKDFITLFASEPEPSIKIDAVSFGSALGLLPVSNLILLVSADKPEEGAARSSFAFQEAVLSPEARPPRNLINGNEFGRYLNFLLKQAAEYAHDRPEKALKRILCFCLMTQFLAPVPDIVEVFESPHLQLLVETDRQETLDQLLDGAPAPVAAACRNARPLRIPPEQLLYARAIKVPELRLMVQDMLGRLNELYDAIRSGDR